MKNLTAVSLRKLLSVVLVIVAGLSTAGFYYGYSWIKNYATEVNQTVVSAHDSTAPNASASTKALQNAVAQQSSVTSTLADFYAPVTSFQSQAIQDINTYAKNSDLTIGDVSITTAGESQLTVTLTPPVSYTSLLKFMSYIQDNLPKMQIQGVSIQHAVSGNSDSATITNLIIKVVTK